MYVVFFMYFKGTLILICCPWDTFWNNFFICDWKTPQTVLSNKTNILGFLIHLVLRCLLVFC